MSAGEERFDPVLFDVFATEIRTFNARLLGELSDGSAPSKLHEIVGSLEAAATIVGATPVGQLVEAVQLLLLTAETRDEGLDETDRARLKEACSWLADLCEQPPKKLPQYLKSNPVPSTRWSQDAPQASARPEPAKTKPLEGVDAPLIEIFKNEVEAHASNLNEGLLQLERNPKDSSSLSLAMRAAHSIKGAARVVGLDFAVRIAHAIEDALSAADAGRIELTTPAVDLLLEGADMLAELGGAHAKSWDGWKARNADAVEDWLSSAHSVHERDSSTPTRRRTAKNPRSQVPTTETERDRVLRVSAGHIDRLMGLAGESLVQAKRFEATLDSLAELKEIQRHISRLLERISQERPASPSDARVQRLIDEAVECSQRSRQTLSTRLESLADLVHNVEDLAGRLYGEVIGSRMRPFRDGVGAFPRMVRDLARELEKEVRLVIVGELTQVDREILERLDAPMTHALRNAVDHGVESPAERTAAGKPAEAVVTLEARHRGGMLLCSVTDDGRGVDVESVRRRVINAGLAGEELAAGLSEAELFEFLFLPGFSTAKEVTEISGRGVGLDVVADVARGVGGSVRMESRVGKGSRLEIQLPVTLSVIRAAVVEIADELYAFPLARMEGIASIPVSTLEVLEDRLHFSMDGRRVGLVPAHQALGLAERSLPELQTPIVLLSDRGRLLGLWVDRFVGQRDLVVRPLDGRLGKTPNISAAAILDDGRALLIVDTDDLVRSIDQLLREGRLRGTRRFQPSGELKPVKTILVVDDSITVRQVERKLLENRGYEVEVAVDGVDAWNALSAGEYDLMLTDVDMPRMNGIDLVRKIRQDRRLRALPVVIVSYKDRSEDRRLGLEAGASAYLTKTSFQDDTLVRRVAELIGEANE